MEELSVKPWVSQYPEQIPTALDDHFEILPNYLKQTASKYPTKKALNFLGKSMTFNEIYIQSLRFANFLRNLGIKKGDRVAIMLPNCPQAVIAYYGILFAEAIIVQTNPLYTERELEHQMNDSGATAIICLDLLINRVCEVKKTTKLQHIFVTGIKDYLPFIKRILYPFSKQPKAPEIPKDHSIHEFNFIMNISAPIEHEPTNSNVDDIAILQYTGGTTGFPKGVMLTHKNLASNTLMAEKWLYKSKKGQEKILTVLPFFHVYGMTTCMNLSIMCAYEMIIVPRFDATQMLEAINKYRPTLFPGAPTMYIALLNHPELKKNDISCIHACLSGSAALPVEVQEQFEKVTGGKLVEGYGLSEASPVTHSNFLWDKRVTGSIGVPWPSTDAKIVSLETGEELPPREIGELIVSGPQVMKGYWNRPEETAATLKDGWLYTGDLGYMDEEGFFYIVDRKKDMINAGGFNVYPRDIEEVLYEHEAIKEAVVVGIPDDYRGETVKAYVVLKEGKSVTEDELDDFCRKYLAAYKVPRVYEFRTDLPKTMIGKILRRTLLEEEEQKNSKTEDSDENLI
ncbi:MULTISPECIES: AMP-binding protein [unclassified Bacillus (in: firmicutes)]|uniref:AMP-binding protein n=1 Tax=unclassified Bacillus (in: firmicutes) TaxID=185979 RepID=UPI000BF1C70B|nr:MULTISPECIES: AMP-binding protein [unclassified Bacillus (in: firmicutes)]PEJ56654.1 long-chain fatty acid--CoA ligase [Bacillus sp. AFS002410]PEL06502.1 long-chain fatty acid--CoA ligase [Bacillus sp. AFS017336]